MVHYMPFSYIPETLLGTLTGLLGPVTICHPLKSLMPVHMRAAAEKGMLHVRFPAGVEQTLLEGAFKEFTTWAELHKGRSADLSGFFRIEQGRVAGMQESARHIRAQIRPAVPNASSAAQDPLFAEALFLSLAHRYDQHQDALRRDLDSVAALEKRFGQILGEPEGPAPLGAFLSSEKDPTGSDPGLYMTGRRIESWARLAGRQPSIGNVFITTSPAVWESLLECLPEATAFLQGGLDAGYAEALAGLCSALSQTPDTSTVATRLPAAEAGQKQGAVLTLHVLAGCSPYKVLSRLAKASLMDEDCPATEPLNTVLGYLQTSAGRP